MALREAPVLIAPPAFGFAPGLICSRWMGNRGCGKPGVTHVLWTEDLENGIVCVEHANELGTMWAYVDAHDYNPLCSIPGVVWDHEGCIMPDDGLLVLSDEARRT